MVRALGTVVAVIAFVIIVAATIGSLAPTVPAAASRAPAPSPTPARSSAAATPVPSQSARTITITFTEQDLTNAATQYMPMTVSGITVTDPHIRLDPGRLTLTATGHAFLLSGAIVVIASPLIVDGSAGAKIESATFAGIALPDATRQNIADTFTRTLRSNIPPNVRVTSLTVIAGALIVEAVPA